MGERDLWAKTRIIASMWWCGDEYCDCTQPLVERITPNAEAGYPFIRRERLWEGQFRSQATADEAKEQAQELADAIARFRAEGHEVEDHL